MTAPMRRRCRRYCLGRAAIYLLILFATCSTLICSYNFYIKVYSEQRNERSSIFIVDKKDFDDAGITSTNNIQFLPEDYFNTTNLACQYPKLTIDNPEIWNNLNPVKEPRPECELSTNWVYVENGLLKKTKIIINMTIEKFFFAYFQVLFDYLNKLYKNMDLLYVLTVLFFVQKMIFQLWKVLVYFRSLIKCPLYPIFFVLIVEREMVVFIQMYIQGLCLMLVYICGKLFVYMEY